MARNRDAQIPLGMVLIRVVTGLTLLFLLAPVVQMVLTAFMKNAFRGPKAGWTTDWISKVLELYGDTIIRSLGIAFGTLVITILIGVLDVDSDRPDAFREADVRGLERVAELIYAP